VDLDVFCVDHVDKMWPIALAFHILFVIQVHENPPMMTSPIDFASSTDFNVRTIVDLNKVDMSFGGIPGPIPYTFGCSKSSQNLYLNVLDVLDFEGHGIKGFGRDFNNPLNRRFACGFYC
jgi:hypothetical protein